LQAGVTAQPDQALRLLEPPHMREELGGEGGYGTQRASANSSRYFPVVRNARSRRPLASGRTFVIA
jgi:hypothetical protein